MDPLGVGGSAAAGADEDVVIAILDAHEGGLADGAGAVAAVGDDDDGETGVAEGGALGAAAALVKLHLVANPLGGGGDVFGHGCLLGFLALLG